MTTYHCDWCGKEFSANGHIKYCSNDCRAAVLNYKKEMEEKGVILDTAQACDHHRRQLKKAEAKKALLMASRRRILKAVHYSSSSVRYEWIAR